MNSETRQALTVIEEVVDQRLEDLEIQSTKLEREIKTTNHTTWVTQTLGEGTAHYRADLTRQQTLVLEESRRLREAVEILRAGLSYDRT